MLQLFIASFRDQTDIEGNGCNNMTNGKKLKQQALHKLKNTSNVKISVDPGKNSKI